MTTLNTIIEEEKTKARIKTQSHCQKVYKDILSQEVIDKTVLYWSARTDTLLTLAMQRAYEAGVQDTVGEIEKRLRQAPLFITENRVVLAIGIDDITSILKDITSDKK